MNSVALLRPGRREYPRAAVAAKVQVQAGGKSLGNFDAEDLSVGGIRIIGRTAIPIGAQVSLRLSMQGGPSMGMLGQVLRTETRGNKRTAVALVFVDLPTNIRTTVGNIVVQDLLAGNGVADFMDENENARPRANTPKTARSP